MVDTIDLANATPEQRTAFQAALTAMGVTAPDPVARAKQIRDAAVLEDFYQATDSDHTNAFNRILAQNRPVILSDGGQYMVSNIKAPAGSPTVILGKTKQPLCRPTITQVPGATGYLIEPVGAYDIRDLMLVPRDADGCYGFGSKAAITPGSAFIDQVYLNGGEFGILFDTAAQHPLGLNYENIYGQNFRTGGICLGGVAGAGTSGESHWNVRATLTDGTSSNVVEVAATVQVDTPSTTFDRLTWDGSNPAMFGWLVIRSADGSTGWHVPPNWSSLLFTGSTFDAQKKAGETWQYAVVRNKRGASFRRANLLTCDIQAEYFGTGIVFDTIRNFNLLGYYSEANDGHGKKGVFSAWAAFQSGGVVGRGYSTKSGYAGLVLNNSKVETSGGVYINGNYHGAYGQGGATDQLIDHGPVSLSSGTLPTLVSLLGSAQGYSRRGLETNAAGETVETLDGTAGGRRVLARRGVTKSQEYCNAAGESVHEVQRLVSVTPSKTLTAPFVNTQFYTDLTIGTATPFLDATLATTNVGAVVRLAFSIEIRDGSIERQTIGGSLDVIIAGTPSDVRATVKPLFDKVIQGGTIASDPIFSATISGSVVTVLCNVTTSLVAARIYVAPIMALGSGAQLSSIVMR